MKFTLGWLKDHLETTATLDEISIKLTSLGLEVEGIANPAKALEGFIVRLREAAPPGPGRPATLEEALVGGTVWIVQRQVRHGAVVDAPDLLPELTEFVVSPYRSVGKR